MFKLTKEVVKSIAGQVLAAANLGSAGLSLLVGTEIIKSEPLPAFIVIVCWWFIMQVIGHVIMMYQVPD